MSAMAWFRQLRVCPRRFAMPGRAVLGTAGRLTTLGELFASLKPASLNGTVLKPRHQMHIQIDERIVLRFVRVIAVGDSERAHAGLPIHVKRGDRT